ncbi:uncharacterized protein LOC113511965 [Galleria mellonella]|uniref:Uncharacterized protein LOC113511965 n=1 Tax=Galleria mellonella TaxID=7137 RepID=A0A6J1WD00_GALME|nr:uncharacterized protein LOC113511965 [Galleria mellonella]XP_052750425.1 uncharacterized protein LOC113511965 [Galleria mellonella]
MKTSTIDKSLKKNGYQSDDDNVRYKLNTSYFNNITKSPTKVVKKQEKVKSEDDDVRYKFPTILSKPKTEQKAKPKPKIKVNFWSNKQTGSRLHNTETKTKTNRRHTVGSTATNTVVVKPKNSGVKVCKRVSFLPSPLFSDNHVPMVTVPDDLTIQLNEEEANDLGEDLNLAFVNSDSSTNENSNTSIKRKPRNSIAHTQTSSKATKRKRSLDDSGSKITVNDNELEFFSKYVVQKLRRMETNQRIYSENLINTVLMLGQLGKLNGKSKIAEA